jgi:hypothetical protein
MPWNDTEWVEQLYRDGAISREEFVRQMRECGLSDSEINDVADLIDEVAQ